MNSQPRRLALAAIAIVALLAGSYYAWSVLSEDPGKSGKPGHYAGTIRTGHLVALDMAPLFLAKEAGYFKQEGLDVETVFFANPGDNNAALTGEGIQFSINPFTLPFLGANSGVPMRIVSGAGGLSIIQIVIKGDLGVANVKELAAWVKANKGKKLKVGTLRGDTLDMIIYRSFLKEGMTYDDFEMIWFNDLLAMVEAFKQKEVDILSHIKPYTTDLVVNYDAKVLTDNSEVWGLGTPNCTVAVLQGFLDKYPETVKGYLRALYKGMELAVNDPERAVSLLSGKGYYRTPDDVLLRALQSAPQTVMLTPHVKGVMSAIDDMIKQKYVKQADPSVFELELVKAIDDSRGR
jgi:ABC-type nitrate/sulfonate/bicarbonate transport system substrate-binding protein